MEYRGLGIPQLHNGKALDPTNISVTIFKDNVDILSRLLSLIINEPGLFLIYLFLYHQCLGKYSKNICIKSPSLATTFKFSSYPFEEY